MDILESVEIEADRNYIDFRFPSNMLIDQIQIFAVTAEL